MSPLLLVAPLVAVLALQAESQPHSRRGRGWRGRSAAELTAYASQWPAHNHDLVNTRATTASRSTRDGRQLKAKWRFKLTGAGAFGAFSSAPIGSVRPSTSRT